MLLAALAARLAALGSLAGTVDFHYLLWDERVYHEWAAALAAGTWRSATVYEFPPLPAYLAAAVYRLAGADALWMRWLDLLLGVVTCWLVYRISARLSGRGVAFATALFAALYAPFVLYSVVPLKTALFLALFALAVDLLLSELDRPRPPRAVALGLTAGLMLEVAGQALPLLPLLGAAVVCASWAGRRSLASPARALALYAAGLLLALAPVAARNARVAGELVLTTSQAGFNLYLGNQLDEPSPYYRPVAFAASSPFEQGIQFTIEASRRAGRRLSPSAASAFWTGEVLRQARERPVAMARKLTVKLGALVNAFEAGDHYDLDVLGRSARFFALPWPRFGLLLPLGLAGLVFAPLPASRRLWLALLLAAYASSLVLFFSNMRYRAPEAVILIPLAMAGAARLAEAIRRRQTWVVAGWAALVALLAVVERLPLAGVGDRTAYLNTHALALEASGSGERAAAAWWEESSRAHGAFSPFADLALAGRLLRQRDLPRGLAALERIPESSFAAAAKHELAGDARVLQGRKEEAAAEYERSLVIAGGRLRPREKLVWLLGELDPARAESERAELERLRAFYPPLQGGGVE